MATFVVPVEPGRVIAAKDAARRDLHHDLGFASGLVSALTLPAFWTHGYHPYAEDGGLYLAGVERALNPALFQHSVAFVTEPARYSIFAAAVAAIVRSTHLGLSTVVLALHLACIWATLFATWLLACRCWTSREERAGAVTLLACWLTLPVAGTALAVMDPYLTARSISTPCMVLALTGMIDATGTRDAVRVRGLLLWLAAMGAAFAVHPLMAAYACAATAMLAITRSRLRGIRIGGAILLAAAGVIAAAWVDFAADPDPAGYRAIALTRTYWFLSRWAWYELLGLAAPIVILALMAIKTRGGTGASRRMAASRALYCMAILVGASSFLTAVCFARTTSASFAVARLQPLRTFQILYFIMIFALGAKLGGNVLRGRMVRWVAAALMLGGAMFAADRSAFPVSPHVELPHTPPRSPWVEAFLWIRENTPPDALFALDPDYINLPGEEAQCFRAIAQRSALPDYSKDGGEASIAPELTAAWAAGQQAQRGLNAASTTDSERAATLKPLGVSWMVLNASSTTHLECPYSNSAVKACRLR